MKKLLVVAIILTFTVGCYTVPLSSPKKYAVKETITKTYGLQPFKSIFLDSDTTIELSNGPYAAIIANVNEDDLYNYGFEVKDQVLRITAANNTLIKIVTPTLNKITVTSNATVNAKDFKTSGLTIIAKNNGTVNLEGQLGIDKIQQRGSGRINVSWIDSDQLFIDSDSAGPLCLAGNVTNMEAKLMNHAQLDARYLRTQNASVFTTDSAHADILVLNTLGGFAMDDSSIYYYKRPKNITVVTKESGNVLHPDWIH
jgi:hypothetical protein